MYAALDAFIPENCLNCRLAARVIVCGKRRCHTFSARHDIKYPISGNVQIVWWDNMRDYWLLFPIWKIIKIMEQQFLISHKFQNSLVGKSKKNAKSMQFIFNLMSSCADDRHEIVVLAQRNLSSLAGCLNKRWINSLSFVMCINIPIMKCEPESISQSFMLIVEQLGPCTSTTMWYIGPVHVVLPHGQTARMPPRHGAIPEQIDALNGPRPC